MSTILKKNKKSSKTRKLLLKMKNQLTIGRMLMLSMVSMQLLKKKKMMRKMKRLRHLKSLISQLKRLNHSRSLTRLKIQLKK